MDDDRLSRVEAQLAIQQLAIRYAIAVDSRDLDLMAAQWLPDVNFGRRGWGPEAVKAYFDPILRVFYRTMHMIVGHRIDLIDAEHATGVVYCRAVHESGRDWIVQAIVYSDEYQRVDGNWYFATRRHHHWYSTDIEERPKAPTFENWPALQGSLPDLPHMWPTWQSFWSKSDPAEVAKLTDAPGPPAGD